MKFARKRSDNTVIHELWSVASMSQIYDLMLSWIFEIVKFCRLTFVAIVLPYRVKKRFLKWRPSAMLNFKKNYIFGHMTIMEFQMYICIPNFVEIGRFFVEI